MQELDPDEQRLLRAIVDGNNKEGIARVLRDSEYGIQKRTANLCKKIGVVGKDQLIIYGVRNLLTPKEQTGWLGAETIEFFLKASFTPRQRAIMKLLVERPGIENADIARELDIGKQTVTGHIGDIFARCALNGATPRLRLTVLCMLYPDALADDQP